MRFATDQEEGPKVDGMTSVEVFEQRREEMLREEELDRLREALRADRGRPSAPRWASAAAWEARRALSLLRKRCLRAPGDPD